MDRRIRVSEFCDLLGCGRTTLHRRISDGKIKPPSKDGKISYWLSSYVKGIINPQQKDEVCQSE